mgnify:CR=1 FL=1
MIRAIRAELHKAATLPATWVGCSVMVLSMMALTVLNALSARGDDAADSAFDVAFYGAPLGVVGSVVVAVVLVSSEYTANSPDAGGGRQIPTTLIAIGSRTRLLVAKAVAMVIVVVPSAAIAIGACIGVATALLGDSAGTPVALNEGLRRAGAVVVYWLLISFMALAVTALTRSGVIPLVFFIVNSAVLPPSFLLSRVTDLAFWLPDTSGFRLLSYGIGQSIDDAQLAMLPGTLVMTAWTLGLLAVAGIVMNRRDA